jgi:dynein heavy chain, axonemal
MTFKLLDSFEGLLDREVIAADLEKKNLDLVRTFGADLKEVAELFHSHKERPVLATNSAPHSGKVAWVRGLVERVEDPMGKLRSMGKVVTDSEGFKEITKTYTALMAAMAEHERVAVEEWCKQVRGTGLLWRSGASR